MTSPTPAQIESAIVGLLSARRPGASICPSDAARRLDPDDWRPLMSPVREVAAKMTSSGEVEITQRGEVVDPSTASGPIRIRFASNRSRRRHE